MCVALCDVELAMKVWRSKWHWPAGAILLALAAVLATVDAMPYYYRSSKNYYNRLGGVGNSRVRAPSPGLMLHIGGGPESAADKYSASAQNLSDLPEDGGTSGLESSSGMNPAMRIMAVFGTLAAAAAALPLASINQQQQSQFQRQDDAFRDRKIEELSAQVVKDL